MVSKKQHENLYDCLGEVITAWRKRLKMSQQELSEASGINRSFISNLEQGRRNPSIGALSSIALGLGTRVSKLLAKCEKCMDIHPGKRR